MLSWIALRIDLRGMSHGNLLDFFKEVVKAAQFDRDLEIL